MNNLSDRILDSQGVSATGTSGYDSKLFYIDVNGIRTNYVTYADIETVTESDTVKLESNKFIKVTQPVTTFNLEFTKDLKNAQLIFETGELGDTSFNIESGMYLNRPLEFESYKIYYISVSNGILLWNELIEQA